MKKISTTILGIAIFLLAALGPNSLQAQNHNRKLITSNTAPFSANRLPHRVGVAYSDGLYSVGGILTEALLLNTLGFHIELIESPGVLNLNYHFVSNSERWAYGVNIGYMPIKYIEKVGRDQKQYSENVIGVTPEIQCYYLKKGLVRLYGSASVGVGVVFGIGNPEYFMDWQINPIGVRVGSNRVAGLLSFGIGTRGFCTVGLQVGL